MKRLLMIGALALSAVIAVAMIPPQPTERDNAAALSLAPDATIAAVDVAPVPAPEPAPAPMSFELLGLAAVAGATRKKSAAKKAAKADTTTSDPNAANQAVADKVAAKAKKDGGPAVYRLDQGEALPGPDPE